MRRSFLPLLVLLTASLSLLTARPEAPAPAGASQPSPQPGSSAGVEQPGLQPAAAPAAQGSAAHPLLDEFGLGEAPGPTTPVIELSKEVLQAYTRFFPARGSYVGSAPVANLLGDFRKSTIAGFLDGCKDQLARLEKIPAEGLTEQGRVEREALRVFLRSMIWLLGTKAAPAHDPNFYVDESIGAIQVLMDREMFTAILRSDHLRARLKRFPALFTTARENLEGCSRPAVQRAITRIRASRGLLEERIPLEFHLPGTMLRRAHGLEAAHDAWLAASAFADWLEKERLPQAAAPAAIGEKAWREWLRTREDADLAPPAVVAAAEADMDRLREEFKATAARISKGKTPAAVLEEVSLSRLEPRRAIEAADKEVRELWSWTVRQRAVELPDDEESVGVREAPAFRRRDAPIRANLPGGYVIAGPDAFLEIAPPDPDWPTPILFSWLDSYGKSFLPLAVMRELYPGRYTAWRHLRHSKIRACRAVSFPMFEEGWGLYAEEMTVRGGYGGDDPKLKLAMLADLLRADARLVASVRLHAMGTRPSEIGGWLEREGFWTKTVAGAELERIFVDPDLASPALGRLSILALRDDFKKAKGASFSPKEFHGRLLSFGSAPVSALRRALLPADTGALLGSSR